MNDDGGALREVLSAKFDELQSAPEPAPEPAAVVETPAEAPVAEAAPAEPTPEPTAAERARDEEGKFTKAPKASKAPKKSSTAAPSAAKPEPTPPAIEDQGAAAEVTSPPAAAPAVPEPPKLAAPQSWKPHAREKWASLPPEVQEEAVRVDREVQRVMRETAEVRKFAQVAQSTLAPFEGLARANGMDSVKYAGSVMQTAAALHMGTPQQKASIVAQLIGTYGIDVDAVNAVMQGQAPAQTAPPVQQPQNLQAEVQRYFEQMQSQQLTATAQAAIDKAKGECEFWNDIGQGKIVTMAAQLITMEPDLAPDVALKNSYDILSARTPSVSAVLKQRQEAEAAKARIASTQQARAAAGSIRSTPAAGADAKPVGLRAVLEDRAAKLGIR
jgi:hypothetical protein